MDTIHDLLDLKARLERGEVNPDDLLFFYQYGSVAIINPMTEEELVYIEDFAGDFGRWLGLPMEFL